MCDAVRFVHAVLIRISQNIRGILTPVMNSIYCAENVIQEHSDLSKDTYVHIATWPQGARIALLYASKHTMHKPSA